MTPRERLARRIGTWFGLDLARGGRLEGLEPVLGQRAQRAGKSEDDYVDGLSGPADPEVALLLETVTVGHTWFFRDPEQTDAIAAVLREPLPGRSRRQVWVAGCATGEDAYTVALLAGTAGLDVDVLGTDVNARALERARAARYAEWSTQKVPPAYESRFTRVEGSLVLDPTVTANVRFFRHNLLDAPPSPRVGDGWDVILCRNVLIYFLRTVASRAVQRLAAALRPGGWLFLGASEVIERAPAGCAIGSIGSRVAIRRLPDSHPAEARTRRRPPPAEQPPQRPKPDTMEHALARLEAGKTDEAIILCAKVLEADPLCVEAHLVSGMAFHLGSDPESAVRALSSAVLLDPQLWPAFFYLGQALEKLGREEDAREAYREADTRARAAPSRNLGVLDAYRGEIAGLARARAQRLVP